MYLNMYYRSFLIYFYKPQFLSKYLHLSHQHASCEPNGNKSLRLHIKMCGYG